MKLVCMHNHLCDYNAFREKSLSGRAHLVTNSALQCHQQSAVRRSDVRITSLQSSSGKRISAPMCAVVAFVEHDTVAGWILDHNHLTHLAFDRLHSNGNAIVT